MENPLTTAAQLQVNVIGEGCKEYLTDKYDVADAMAVLVPMATAFPEKMSRLDCAAFCVYMGMKCLELYHEKR